MKTIRCGIIGLGWFGEKHCEALHDLPQAQIHAVCTRRPDRLKEVVDRFDIPASYTNYHDMLADPEIDVVSVVTMWDQHVEPAIAALEAGKHVFLEKPMASSVVDCDRILAAVAKAPGKFMVGHICRFNPRYAAAKAEIDSGAIGEVVSIYARRNLPAWITEAVLDKIGPISGDAVHDTDLMLWYTGANIKTAYGQTHRVRDKKFPDIGWTMYRFDNGAIGVSEVVWALPGKTPIQIDERMQIVGTTGSIQIHDTAPNLFVVDQESTRHPDTTYWPELHGQRVGALRSEWEYFLKCVTDNTQPSVVPPTDSRAAIAACLAAEKSAEIGQVIEL
ncbi:MAG: Gfo/Idh/MocA family oxidoreductase [Pirellulaceae bacterium]|nr:Gfo/Idh/MocA family oxidoreductase [Pirellulaceae bacterium]